MLGLFWGLGTGVQGLIRGFPKLGTSLWKSLESGSYFLGNYMWSPYLWKLPLSGLSFAGKRAEVSSEGAL